MKLLDCAFFILAAERAANRNLFQLLAGHGAFRYLFQYLTEMREIGMRPEKAA